MSLNTKSSKELLNNEKKPNLLLSDLINSEERKVFIKNNKKALKCFQDFIKYQNNKSRNNNKLSLRLINLNTNSNIENFKKNPILILKSHDKNLFDEKKRKFKSKTLGVDEGLISIPKENNNNNYIKGNETSRFKNNLDLKNMENEEKSSLTRKKTSDNLIYSAKSLSTNKKLIKINELDRGEELVTKTIKCSKRSTELNYKIKMKKLKEDFEQQLNYNFELKKLNNWDFLNLPRYNNNLTSDKSSNSTRRRKSIINFSNLNEEDASNMGWLLNIRNDKEKLKVISRIKQLNDFFIGFGKEQDDIFMQTMKMNKKGFMFDAFYKSKEELKDIKIEENEIASGINYYREVMKVKIKREEMFKSEICACAEELRMARIEKQKCIIESYEMVNELEEISKKESDIINELNINSKNNLFYTSSGKDKKFINNQNYKSEKRMQDNKKSITFRNNYLYKEKKEFSKIHKSDKKISKKNKLLKIQINNDLILKSLAEIRKRKNIIEEKIKENNIILNNIQIKNKKAKANFTEKVQMLSEYYYQILKKGIDVRKSGLSWVVVKLMELNAFIDKNHFPTFLSDSEINYLMKVGVKTYELNELIKLFQLLKMRQKKLRERHVQEDKDKENQKKEETFNKLKEAHKGNKYNIGNDYVEYMEEIQRKYENVINACLNEKTEENDINQISEKIKKQILKMQDDGIDEINNSKLYELYFIPGSLAQYFSQDKIFRQYFDDIYYLNEEINKRRIELKKEKEIEYKKYRKKLNTNYFVKNISGKEIIVKSKSVEKKDQIMAALFGNDITV